MPIIKCLPLAVVCICLILLAPTLNGYINAAFAQEQGNAQGGVPPCSGMVPLAGQERAGLETLINDLGERYNAGNKRWSRLYHWSLYGSAILSALAALVLKLRVSKKRKIQPYQTDLAALLAALSAILITVNSAGKLNQRWQTDRLAKNAIIQLKVELTNPCVAGGEIRKKLNDIVTKQSEGAR